MQRSEVSCGPPEKGGEMRKNELWVFYVEVSDE